MRTEVLGIGFDPVTMEEAVSWALSEMEGQKGAFICTPNPEIVWQARKNPDLRCAINEASLVLPDGTGIQWAARRLGHPIPERVAGCDFLLELLAHMKGSVFLLGGKPGVAEDAAAFLEKNFPDVTVAGCQCGYAFADEALLDRIRQVEPTLLLVCLGSPKQELWMAAHGNDLPSTLMVGLGGSIDVLAGRVKRAPQRWRDRGLEWFYRLLQDPRRLRRQIRLPLFVLAVLFEGNRK